MALITYDDKVALNENPSIADINKVKADDMNEIKSVVNGLIVNTQNSSTTNTYSCNYVNDCNTYSTNEVDTGKKWIDGKTIYRKVYTGTANSTNNTIDTKAHISNLNFISINGWIKKSATVQQLIGMYVNSDNSSGVFVDTGGLKLLMPSIWASSSTTYIVIVEYTKSS